MSAYHRMPSAVFSEKRRKKKLSGDVEPLICWVSDQWTWENEKEDIKEEKEGRKKENLTIIVGVQSQGKF